MISSETFAKGWALMVISLANAPREDDDTSRVYYGILSRHLTDEEFIGAVERVLETERFWPSPAVILQAARPPAKEASEQLRALVSDVNAHGGFRFYPPEKFRALPAPVREGISAVGGLRAIAMCEEHQWQWLERRFTAAYNDATMAARRAPAIAATCTTRVRNTGTRRELPAGVRQLVQATAAAMGTGMDLRKSGAGPRRTEEDAA